jgi:hypothetical protein
MATTEENKTKAVRKIEKAVKKGFRKGLTLSVIDAAVSRGIDKATANSREKNIELLDWFTTDLMSSRRQD